MPEVFQVLPQMLSSNVIVLLSVSEGSAVQIVVSLYHSSPASFVVFSQTTEDVVLSHVFVASAPVSPVESL